MNYTNTASEEQLMKTKVALEKNGFDVSIVETSADAKAMVLELLPPGDDIMTMTSRTLEETGIAEAINASANYNSVRNKLNAMDRNTQSREMQQLGSAPHWAVGSVQAITEDGKAIMASGTGSQLPAYVYGAAHVIWVVGTNKLVKNLDAGIKRINEHILPLESERVKVAYGMPGSSVNKLLIIQKEAPHRIQVVLVKETLGY